MRSRRARTIGILILSSGVAVLIGLGCSLVEVFRGLSRPSFSHAFHVGEKKIECQDCHADYETGDRAGMPVLDTCMPCHEGIDRTKPPPKGVQAFVQNGEPVWSSFTLISEEVIFSHKVHHEKGVACDACHRGVGQSTGVSSRLRIGMQECMDCHARSKAPNECSTCHRTIRKEVPPPDHRLNWPELHGQTVRGGAGAREQCSICHQEDQCATCHREVLPRSHTNFWRQRGHGVAVRIDRETCRTCHQVDFCERCHQEVAPRSHIGSFGAPMDRHCLGCHSPLQSGEECAVCHRATPSHLLAAPKPSWHSPAMNCRQCHGAGQSLPHVDNGDNCNGCHH